MNDALPTSAAAERNKEPILAVLRPLLPRPGAVLEIASGTGQHIVHFARHLPHVRWTPSDPDEANRVVIAQRLRQAALPNVQAPLVLDARDGSWPGIADLLGIVCINMIHIAPWSAGQALLRQAAQALPSGGFLMLYGPFKRQGRHTAPSNEEFDRSLRQRDPAWGVRDLEEVAREARAAGLQLAEVTSMPANNLTVVFTRR